MCRSIEEGGRRCAGRGGISQRTQIEALGKYESMGGKLSNTSYGGHEGADFHVPTVEEMRMQIEEMRSNLSALTAPRELHETAKNAADEDLLRILAEASDPSVVSSLEENVNLSPELREALPAITMDRTRWERVRQVYHDFTDALRLRRYASDESVWVRLAVVSHPKTDRETLERLSKDENPYVRFAVAILPSTPKSIWLSLKEDEHLFVKYGAKSRADMYRASIARQTKRDSSFRHLSAAEKLKVAKSSRTHGNLLHDIQMFEKDREIITAVAENPRAKPHTLADIYEYHGHAEVMTAVASNGNTSRAILTELSSHYDSHVRAGVSRNANTPDSILILMKGDSSPSVRAGVVMNEAYTCDSLELERLSGDRSWQMKEAVALNAFTSPETLQKLAKHRNLNVRRAVAGNPNTSEKILMKISKGGHASVSKEARNNLVKRLSS